MKPKSVVWSHGESHECPEVAGATGHAAQGLPGLSLHGLAGSWAPQTQLGKAWLLVC